MALEIITREEEPHAVPLTPPTHDPGSLRTPTSATLSTSLTDNSRDGLRERKYIDASTRAKKQKRNCFQPRPRRIIPGTPHLISPARKMKGENTRLHHSRPQRIIPGTLGTIPQPTSVCTAQGSYTFSSDQNGRVSYRHPPPPPSTTRRASGRRKVIQSPGRWSARPRTANNHP